MKKGFLNSSTAPMTRSVVAFRVPAWAVVAVCPRHIAGLVACQTRFGRFVSPANRPSVRLTDDLRWYFAMRRTVEAHQVDRLSVTEINRFREAQHRFATAPIEDLYAEWVHCGDHAPAASQHAVDSDSTLTEGRLLLEWLPLRYEQFGSLAGVC
jgi:hypothetical protein